MKAYQAGLLLAGAGIAAGVAFRMTQPPPIPVNMAAVQAPVPAPPVTEVSSRKPSPLEVTPGVRTAPALKAAAPDTVYDDPPKAPIRKNEAKSASVPSRKNEANLTASMKPRQWVPSRYASRVAALPAKAAEAANVSAAVVPAVADKNAAVRVAPAVDKQPEAVTTPPSQPPPLHEATLHSGMAIAIRLGEPLSSNYSRAGATFAGFLIEPLIGGGFVIAERGARVTGRIVDSQKAGRFTGLSRIQLGLMSVMTSDGQQVGISTEPWTELSDNLPAQTVVRFRLKSPVTITEQPVGSR